MGCLHGRNIAQPPLSDASPVANDIYGVETPVCGQLDNALAHLRCGAILDNSVTCGSDEKKRACHVTRNVRGFASL